MSFSLLHIRKSSNFSCLDSLLCIFLPFARTPFYSVSSLSSTFFIVPVTQTQWTGCSSLSLPFLRFSLTLPVINFILKRLLPSSTVQFSPSRFSSLVYMADIFSKSKAVDEDFVVDLLAGSPTLDYYFHAIQGANNLRSGRRPKGLSPKAIYNAFLGHLVRGEVTIMHIRLAPNALLKANFKLRGSEKVYQVPILDTEDDSIYCQPRMYRGIHFNGFKGGSISHRFMIDHLIITIEDVNTSFPMYTGGELLNMKYAKSTVFGLLDNYYVDTLKRKCKDVTLLPETTQKPLISTTFEYLDYTAVILY